MALHHHLKLWQKILLGIFCFPLLPFYLCVYCLCLKDDKKEKDLERSNHGAGQRDAAGNNAQDTRIRLSFRNKGFQNDDEESRQEKHITDVDINNDKDQNDLKKNDHGTGHKDGAWNNNPDNSIRLSFRNKGFQTADEENRQVKRNRDIEHKESDESVSQKRKKQKFKTTAKFYYPWDRSNLKSLMIDLNAFEKLDLFASKLDTKGTVEQLVKELIRDANTDLEKTRVIWIWICHHIEYDIQGYTNKALRSSEPNDVLRTRKGVCAGYASMFQHMCSIAGVQCKEVSGYAKGVAYDVGQKITGESNHAWNMVYLEGGWHLVDSTWAAGNADDNVTKFTFQYSEFYFLTHPALFIGDHFPEDSDCQLLETCVSQEQFEKSVHARSDFYSLDMVSYQPETAVIETVKGKASIVVEGCHNLLFTFDLNKTETSGLLKLLDNGMKLDVYPQQTGQHVLQIYSHRKDSAEHFKLILDYRVYCSFADTSMKIPKCLNNPVGPSWISRKAGLLSPSHPDPVIHTDDGCCTISFKTDRMLDIIANLKCDHIETMPNHVIQSEQKHKVEFSIRLPQAGSYVLLIFDGPNGYICNYLIICSNPNIKWPPFPSTLCNPVGLTLKTENAGLLRPSHPDPVVHTEDGCCTISFGTDRMLGLTVNLKSDDTQNITKHVIQSVQKHKVEFNVRLPHAGSYAFLIFDDSSGYICNYLIICSNPNVKWPPLPSTLHNPVGPTSKTEKAGLIQPSHPDPVIHTDDGCCTISFALKQDTNLYCTLHSDEVQMTKEMERKHVFQTQKEGKVEINVRLPQSGTYVLQVFIKLGNNKTKNCTYLCNYLIICTNTTVKWPVFPLTYANWEKHFDLMEPLEGVLPKKINISFKLQIPGVSGVCIDGNSYIPLTLADNGYWEGTCSTVDRKELIVMIKYINEPNTWHYILKYEVGEK